MRWSCDVESRRRDGRGCRALAYPAWSGAPSPATGAAQHHGARARPRHRRATRWSSRCPTGCRRTRSPGPGHLVKARYTPLQAMVLGVDEQDSPHHDALRDADDLAGMPVVVADLHSALPAIVAGVRADRPDARVAYVMTDGGALPAWFSRTRRGAARGRLAGGVHHRRAGVRRRPGGGHAAHRAARRAPRRSTRTWWSSPRARATSAPAPAGVLRRGRRRGGQRRRGAGRAAGRGAAGLRRRPAGAPPRRVPPLADRLRPGRAGPRGRRRPGAGRARLRPSAALACSASWRRPARSCRPPGRHRLVRCRWTG